MRPLYNVISFAMVAASAQTAAAQVDPFPDNVDNVWVCEIDGLADPLEFHTTADTLENNQRFGFGVASSADVYVEYDMRLDANFVRMANVDDGQLLAEIVYDTGLIVFKPDGDSGPEMRGQCEKTF